ncbi:DDE-type integrase/transposase/recombinase [Streptomyces sp. 769]|uniref:DDE-type integrase/transposase/recombinase n=1 Tax=Streptomyces sp. 769 TaxID=1262452 RepID=UPI001EEFF457|nr:DDE-type integrase/transposase/recombinase [Streptomyces sp. 769]
MAGQDGNVLGVLVTAKRDARAAQWFFRRLLRDLQYVPRVAVADKLRSSIPVRLLRYLTPLPAPPPPAHRPACRRAMSGAPPPGRRLPAAPRRPPDDGTRHAILAPVRLNSR